MPEILILAAVSVLALLVSAWAMWQVNGAIAFMLRENEQSVSLTKLTQMQCDLTDLQDSFEALVASHKTLRSRVGMRENREKKSNHTDLGALGKRELRAKLAGEGKLNPKFHQ